MITTLKDLDVTFSQDVEQDVRYVINAFGDGDHPMADDKTLPYFAVHYVITCITRALLRTICTTRHADEVTKERLRGALDTIKNAHVESKRVHNIGEQS